MYTYEHNIIPYVSAAALRIVGDRSWRGGGESYVFTTTPRIHQLTYDKIFGDQYNIISTV